MSEFLSLPWRPNPPGFKFSPHHKTEYMPGEVVVDSYGHAVCLMEGPYGAHHSGEELAANLLLILAAPDLLRACIEAEAELTNGRGGWPNWDQTPGRVQGALNVIRAAIAAAEGREP